MWTGDAESAVFVGAVELDDLIGDVFEEIAVVADDHAGELAIAENSFEPIDACEIEMVGGLIEEKNVGLADQGFGNGQALAPTAGEGSGGGFEVEKSCSAENFGHAGETLGFGDFFFAESLFDDGANGVACGEFGDLFDEMQAGALADGDVAAIRGNAATEHFHQGGFAGTVGADNADAVAFGDGEGDFLEERESSETFGKALRANDGWQWVKRSLGSRW